MGPGTLQGRAFTRLAYSTPEPSAPSPGPAQHQTPNLPSPPDASAQLTPGPHPPLHQGTCFLTTATAPMGSQLLPSLPLCPSTPEYQVHLDRASISLLIWKRV